MRDPITLFRDSIDIFLTNPKSFIGIYLIPGILTFLLALLIGFAEGLGLSTPVKVLAGAVLTIIIIVVSIFMAIAILHEVVDPSLSIRQAYERSKPFFWKYLLLTIVVSFVTFVGFLLLIIPGIIIFVWLAFCYYILIIENAGVIDSMKESKKLVTGKWFAVFGRLIALIAAAILVSIIFSMLTSIGDSAVSEALFSILNVVANAFLVPVSVAYVYLMYKDLKQGTSQTAEVYDLSSSPASTVQIDSEAI